MNKDTPARLIRQKDLDANTMALATVCRTWISPPPKRVLDVRYGLGGWARQWHAQNFGRKMWYVGFEADSLTYKKAYRPQGVKLVNEPFLPAEREEFQGWADLLLADFNTVTVKKRAELDAVLVLRPKAIIFTDVACVKLHLNYKTYGLTKPELADYWSGFGINGYSFVAYARHHHPASTALYTRDD